MFSQYVGILCKEADKCFSYGIFRETAGKRFGVLNEVRPVADAGRQADLTL